MQIREIKNRLSFLKNLLSTNTYSLDLISIGQKNRILKKGNNHKRRFFIFLMPLFLLSGMTAISAQTGCYELDWEIDCSGNPFDEGFYVTPDAYDCIGVTITNNSSLPIVLFNSSAPTGGDTDLGTPSSNCPSCTGSCPGQSNNANGGLTNCVDQGLVMITEENPSDNNGDGLEDNPDDYFESDYTFSFAAPVTISTLDFIDDSMGEIVFTYSNGSTSTVPLLGGLDNDVYSQVFSESDVISMQIILTTSGAISLANFCYDEENQTPCDLVAPVLGADVDICEGDDPGPIEVLAPASGTGVITYKWQQSLVGCEGFGDIPGATSPTYNPGVLVQSTYFKVVVTIAEGNQVCVEESNCISYVEEACPECVHPVVTASAIQPTCENSPPQNNGYLEIATISVGDAYHWSLGSTFNNNGGSKTYSNATSISTSTFPVQFAMGQPNPNGTQQYTIRVYNGANDCYTDEVVTMNQQNCYDWGDLPDMVAGTGFLNYETNSTNSGPSHLIVSGLHIGSTVDSEDNGQQSSNALGDGADEDGFNFPNHLDIVPGGILNLPIDVVNTTGTTAHYEIWIDWNADGNFNGPGEMVADLSDDGAGNFGQSTFQVNIPQNVSINQLFGFRARLSHTNNMTSLGQIQSGEVEDYLIIATCKDPICLPVQIVIMNN